MCYFERLSLACIWKPDFASSVLTEYLSDRSNRDCTSRPSMHICPRTYTLSFSKNVFYNEKTY